MKTRFLVSCILLSILVLFLLSSVVQATEYKEVNTEVEADDVLKHIENGEDISLTNCHIIGRLNTSKLKLETVPNSNFDKLLKIGFPKEYLIKEGFDEKLSVIKSNIIITNSSFENDLDFSSVLFTNFVAFPETTFKNSASFNGATFNNTTNFLGVTFDNKADFIGVTFNDSSDFMVKTFNNNADFNGATFTNYTSFSGATFDGYTSFDKATFNNANFNGATFNYYVVFCNTTFNAYSSFNEAKFNYYAVFCNTTFNAYSSFNEAKFNAYSSFYNTTFNNYAYFYRTTFNNADFIAPETSKNIFTDGKNCEFFMKYYNNNALYTDADNIYYNYRIAEMRTKNLLSFSRLTDILSLVTCGFGTKLSYTLYCSWFCIIAFAYFCYRPHTTVSVVKNKNKLGPVKVYWKESGIYKLSDAAEKKSILSFWDALYFSINTFTKLGSVDFHPRDNIRKWVTLEGLLGWIMLALVMSTLMKLFIRS